MSKRRRSGQSKWILRSFDTLAQAFHPTRHRSIACIMCVIPLKPSSRSRLRPHQSIICSIDFRSSSSHTGRLYINPTHQPLSANSATHKSLLPTEQIKTETVQKTTTEETNQHPLQLLDRPRNPLPQRSKNRLRLLDRSFLFPRNCISTTAHT